MTSTSTDAPAARPGFSARLWGVMLLCAMVMMIDGYDLSAMPLAVPHIVRQWQMEPSRFSLALSAVLIGLGTGAVMLGPLGDRFGRRPVIIAGTSAIALFTIATASAASTVQFALWRLLTGLALGACLPNVTAFVSEVAPPHRRASVLTIISCGISLGGMGAGFLAPLLVSGGHWQPIFIMPGLFTLLLSVLLLFFLPESPRFLLSRGGHEGWAQPRGKLGIAKAPAPCSTPADGMDARGRRNGRSALPALVQRQYLLATIVFIGLYTLNALSLYMLVSWLPTILPDAGFSLDQASRLTSTLQGGGLAGGLVLSWFLDRGKTVAALAGAYLLVAAILLSFGLVPATLLSWGVMLLVVGGCISGAHQAIMAVGTGFYPSSMLSSAIGVAVCVARIGAIAGPFAGGWLIHRGISTPAFLAAVVAPVAACLGMTLLIRLVEAKRVDSRVPPTAIVGSRQQPG